MHLTYPKTFDSEAAESFATSETEVTEAMLDAARDAAERAYCGGGVYALTDETFTEIYRAMRRVSA